MTDRDPIHEREMVYRLFAVYVDGDARKRKEALDIVLVQGRSQRDAAKEVGMAPSTVRRLIVGFWKMVESMDPQVMMDAMEDADDADAR